MKPPRAMAACAAMMMVAFMRPRAHPGIAQLASYPKLRSCDRPCPDVPVYIMERIAEVHLENLKRVLKPAGDLIEIVYFYDDVASQERLLMRPEMYRRHIQPFHQRIIDVAVSHGKRAMMHCRGSVYPLINRLIEMGLSILNPIQPSAKNMNPEKLAQEFGGRIAFHGCIDTHSITFLFVTLFGSHDWLKINRERLR